MTVIIPAIDLLGGKVVRLRQGRYDDVTVFDDDPPGRAKLFRDHGATRLHVVDLEGAKAGEPVQRDVIEAIIRAFEGEVQVGGGVRTLESYEAYLGLGARRVIVGTRAAQDPDAVLAIARAHPDTAIVAVDAEDGVVKTWGWTEFANITAIDLARRFATHPVSAVLYTDIAQDGTGAGPNVAATRRLADATGLYVIASGGVGSVDHLRALSAAGVPAAIVGRALYDGTVPLTTLSRLEF